MNVDDWMITTYDRIVADAGTSGITIKDARDRAAQAYEHAVRDGTITRPVMDLYLEGSEKFDRVIRPQRQARKTSLHRDMETITAALNSESILGEADPTLSIAYPLGTMDGRDKILSLWTSEDWRNAAMTRYRNAAGVTAAAQIFDEQAAIISDRMRATGAETTGALFTPKAAA